jgi:Alpha-glucuronidase
MKFWAAFWVAFFFFFWSKAEDGYNLWLRYQKIDRPELLQEYRRLITGIMAPDNTAGKELQTALECMLAKKLPLKGNLIVQTGPTGLGPEGFTIRSTNNSFRITAEAEAGLLYGVFHFLRLIQTHQPITQLNISSKPSIPYRLLNHWDNLNRTVERGYAGNSIWDWQRLPGYIDQRYIDYARANASIGINGTVLTNVNANALVLTEACLKKIAALANVFRDYHIKVYLTARFSAPVEIGGLKTADPLDQQVRQWWKDKVNEIYQLIPDFGGFLVKANSEGQPGPQNYKRTHADGANMLADAVAPHGGMVMWRAFVYSNETPEDRFKQAYNEFKPLDGQFHKHVMVQVKNGPIDFQPREPYHPLFDAMPQTPLMMELQLTQEYLGFATHLVYMGPLFKEVLNEKMTIAGMAGVSNIGSAINWTGHPFGQANWYTLGRLAWDQSLSAEQIAREWLQQTFTNDTRFVDSVARLMLASHNILVNYMTPLGLHHIMGYGHHYGPAPWYDRAPRADWNPVYFHRADSVGIGFDRTATGSNALAQYPPEVRKRYEDMRTCPEDYLLWFHHVPWNFTMQSGRSLWEEMCYKYYSAADSVKWMQQCWENMAGYIDEERFKQVKMLLGIQAQEAVWWRNACLLYFQTFSRKPIPAGYEQPEQSLKYYKELRFPYAPN